MKCSIYFIFTCSWQTELYSHLRLGWCYHRFPFSTFKLLSCLSQSLRFLISNRLNLKRCLKQILLLLCVASPSLQPYSCAYSYRSAACLLYMRMRAHQHTKYHHPVAKVKTHRLKRNTRLLKVWLCSAALSLWELLPMWILPIKMSSFVFVSVGSGGRTLHCSGSSDFTGLAGCKLLSVPRQTQVMS